MKVFKNEKARTKVFETYDQLLAMWGTELREMDVDTEYGSTHLIVCGNESNPPLVLFHGVGDNSALMWIYNARELSKHFCVYAVDTIGGPGKSRPNENYNKGFDQIRWVDEVFAGLKIEKAYVAGVSNGAYITQHYGIYRPEKVIKMVCMSGGIAAAGGGNPLKTMLKVFLPEALFPTKANVTKLIKKLSGEHSNVFTDNAVIMEHYAHLLRGFNNMSMAYHRIETFDEKQISNIAGKCIFLCGAADPLGRDNAHRAKATFEKFQIQYQIYEGVGHGINHEISEVINNRIIEYLNAR